MHSTRLYRAGAESEAEGGPTPRRRASAERASEPAHSSLIALPGLWTARPAVTLGGAAEATRIARASRGRLDALSAEGEYPGWNYLDQAGGAGAPAPGIGGSIARALAALLAEPTELIQIVTSWTGGTTEYGFQLMFRCRSTSGNVADLQAKAPNLIWRERVTYRRNDFAHHITPPNPTILPVSGGISFAPARTRTVGTNLLEFTTARDRHHMPTSAVRAADFTGVPAALLFRFLPAIMESHQLYQFSLDGGTTWRRFAGGFNIRRTLFRDAAGNLRFTTNKVGIHSITENYKP